MDLDTFQELFKGSHGGYFVLFENEGIKMNEEADIQANCLPQKMKLTKTK